MKYSASRSVLSGFNDILKKTFGKNAASDIFPPKMAKKSRFPLTWGSGRPPSRLKGRVQAKRAFLSFFRTKNFKLI